MAKTHEEAPVALEIAGKAAPKDDSRDRESAEQSITEGGGEGGKPDPAREEEIEIGG